MLSYLNHRQPGTLHVSEFRSSDYLKTHRRATCNFAPLAGTLYWILFRLVVGAVTPTDSSPQDGAEDGAESEGEADKTSGQENRS